MTDTSPQPRPITRVLVANRGEIARRVFATCRRLGIGCVAVHSDPDAGSPHVAEADVAVRLPGRTSAETYLDGDAVVAAALASGADAVHPGYGFLSENAGFARAVIAAGLTWIGPPPAAIDAMGSKVAAKALMADAGVPVLANLDPAAVTDADLPVLVKASAGGGGRGMRVVTDVAELEAQVAAASREAASAFGDGTVFCEPYIERGHHIEMQIMADAHGDVWTVGERECSIQRRHQKVVEEAPSPLVERHGDQLRARLFAAAEAAAKAIDYVGAGTVEFLAADDGRFFFLEMNTRLQVEHPVTENTAGVDLVEWQLLAAEGRRLPERPTPPGGHSIEVRLYAEDPAAGWQPQSGTLHRVRLGGEPSASRPVHRAELPGEPFAPLTRPGLRVDGGVVDGSEVSVFYDPMLAKVISWAPDRGRAAAMLAGALQRAVLHGPTTNRDLLVRTLRHPRFLAGRTDTTFLDETGLAAPLLDERGRREAAIAAALAAAAAAHAASLHAHLPIGWRNMPAAPRTREFDDGSVVRYRFGRHGVELPDDGDVSVSVATPDVVALVRDGVTRRYTVARYGADVYVDSADGSLRLRETPRFTDPSTLVAAGSLTAPMPGSIVRLAVAEGDTVVAGTPILWLEAMKMEHTVVAPAGGIVTSLPVAVGQQVGVGDVLAVVADTD